MVKWRQVVGSLPKRYLWLNKCLSGSLGRPHRPSGMTGAEMRSRHAQKLVKVASESPLQGPRWVGVQFDCPRYSLIPVTDEYLNRVSVPGSVLKEYPI